MRGNPGDSGIRWDPYEVWRRLVLADPELLLQPSCCEDTVNDAHTAEFALTIADFPDDLQDVLYVIAQRRGAEEALAALDTAIREFFEERRHDGRTDSDSS